MATYFYSKVKQILAADELCDINKVINKIKSLL